MLRLAGSWLLGARRPAQHCSCMLLLRGFADGDAQDRAQLLNKLLYRSKQRGWLELDLLMGLWAEQHLPTMQADMLQQYAQVLDQENPELYKWLTGQQPPPDHMQSNAAYQALAAHVAQQMSDNVQPAAHAASGREWVRGWDDGGRAASSSTEGRRRAVAAQPDAPQP